MGARRRTAAAVAADERIAAARSAARFEPRASSASRAARRACRRLLAHVAVGSATALAALAALNVCMLRDAGNGLVEAAVDGHEPAAAARAIAEVGRARPRPRPHRHRKGGPLFVAARKHGASAARLLELSAEPLDRFAAAAVPPLLAKLRARLRLRRRRVGECPLQRPRRGVAARAEGGRRLERRRGGARAATPAALDDRLLQLGRRAAAAAALGARSSSSSPSSSFTTTAAAAGRASAERSVCSTASSAQGRSRSRRAASPAAIGASPRRRPRRAARAPLVVRREVRRRALGDDLCEEVFRRPQRRVDVGGRARLDDVARAGGGRLASGGTASW